MKPITMEEVIKLVNESVAKAINDAYERAAKVAESDCFFDGTGRLRPCKRQLDDSYDTCTECRLAAEIRKLKEGGVK